MMTRGIMDVAATIHVTPAGLTEQDRLIVNTAIKLLSIDGIHYQLNSAINNAHLLILDEDSIDGKAVLRQSRPGQVKLIISAKPTMAKNSIGLQRPMDLGNLKGLLKNLYSKLQTQLSAQRQQRAVNEKPASIDELNASLFTVLIETKIKKRILHLLTAGLPDIFVDGINRCLATTATDTQLEQLLQIPLANIILDQLNPESFAVHSNEMNIQSLHNLIWLAGIKCSAGRILPGHSLDKPVRLRAWPNFTRNTFIADHLKLAAVLAKQPMTLQQLAATTRQPMAEVVNFYNAAFAVDLIEFQQPAPHAVPPPARPSQEKQSLLAKIAKRLNIRNMF